MNTYTFDVEIKLKVKVRQESLDQANRKIARFIRGLYLGDSYVEVEQLEHQAEPRSQRLGAAR